MEYTTYELSVICGVTERAISKWAGNNGVAKRGRYWDYTEDDYARIFEHYGVSEQSSVVREQNIKRTNDCSELVSELKEQVKAQENELQQSREKIAALEESLTKSQEQVSSLMQMLETTQEQVSALIETNKAISATNAAQTIAENKELLLSDGSKKWWQFWK